MTVGQCSQLMSLQPSISLTIFLTRYGTEYFWSYQRGLSNDSTYKPIELEIGTEYVAPINEEKTLYMHTEPKSDFGLTIDYTAGMKHGIMVWAYSNTNVQDSAMAIGLRQSSISIEVASDSISMFSLSPSDADKILGGLFVVPKYEQGGRVQYLLVGVAVKKGKADWALQLLNTESNVTKSVDKKDSSDNKKGKKGKEDNNRDASEPTPTKK